MTRLISRSHLIACLLVVSFRPGSTASSETTAASSPSGNVDLTEPILPEAPMTHLRDFRDPFWDNPSNWPPLITNGRFLYRLRFRAVTGTQVDSEAAKKILADGGRIRALYELCENEWARISDARERSSEGNAGIDAEEDLNNDAFGPWFIWEGENVVMRGMEHRAITLVYHLRADGTRRLLAMNDSINNRTIIKQYDALGRVTAFFEGSYCDDRDYDGRTISVIEGKVVSFRAFAMHIRGVQADSRSDDSLNESTMPGIESDEDK